MNNNISIVILGAAGQMKNKTLILSGFIIVKFILQYLLINPAYGNMEQKSSCCSEQGSISIKRILNEIEERKNRH